MNASAPQMKATALQRRNRRNQRQREGFGGVLVYFGGFFLVFFAKVRPRARSYQVRST
jgi:hypothetical protein